MSNKVYDILKWIAVIVLPAIGTLYATISAIWGFPFTEEVPATIMAIDTFLGAVMMISSNNYSKKTITEETK